MSFPVFDSPSAEVRVSGGTLVNYGPAVLYYRDEAPVTPGLADGSLTAGSSATLEGAQWLVTAPGTRASVDVILPPPQSGGGGGTLEITITGTPEVGQTLTADSPGVADTQWLRSGAPISGADESTYEVQPADQGWAITCRASVFSNELEVPASPRPTLTRAVFSGDSYAAGGTEDLTNPYPVIVCDASHLNITADNTGVGGSTQWFAGGLCIADQVWGHATGIPDVAPYAPVEWCWSIQTSVNNLNKNAGIANSFRVVTETLLCELHRARAGGHYGIQDTDFWARNAGVWSGERVTGDDTATLTTPEDFPGGELRLLGVSFTGSGGIHTVTVDGDPVSGVARGAAATSGGTPSDTFDTTVGSVGGTDNEPWEFGFDIDAGVHEIEVTFGDLAGAGAFFAGAHFEAGTSLPLIVIPAVCRAIAYPGGETAINDARVTAANAATVAMLTAEFGIPTSKSYGLVYEGGNVVYVDTDAAIGKNPAYFSSDTIHLNDTGAPVYATPIVDAIEENY